MQRTLTHFAAKGGHKNILEYFVDAQAADIEIKDKFGVSIQGNIAEGS